MSRVSTVVALLLLSVSFTSVARGQEASDDAASAEASSVQQTDAPPATPTSGVETQDYVPFGIAGLVTFGASWIGTIVIAATTESGQKKRATGHAAVPVGGPFIMLAERSHVDDVEGVLIGLGALQGVGLGATLLGFTLESRVVVGDASGAHFSPIVGPTHVGLTGAF